MDYQTAFNVVLGIASALGGFVVRALWQADKDLADKVGKIEVLVAGEYMKRGEFDIKVDALFAKLDRIEGKIDGKVDK